MKPTAYPDAFMIAHRLFTGTPFADGGEWGSALDGPLVDDQDVIETLLESFKGDEFGPDRDNLRVWQIVPGRPAEDCTDWAIKTVFETLELRAGV